MLHSEITSIITCAKELRVILNNSGDTNIVLNDLCCHLLGLTNSKTVTVMEELKNSSVFLMGQNFKFRKLYSLECLFIANSDINSYLYLISAAGHLTVTLL